VQRRERGSAAAAHDDTLHRLGAREDKPRDGRSIASAAAAADAALPTCQVHHLAHGGGRERIATASVSGANRPD